MICRHFFALISKIPLELKFIIVAINLRQFYYDPKCIFALIDFSLFCGDQTTRLRNV